MPSTSLGLRHRSLSIAARPPAAEAPPATTVQFGEPRGLWFRVRADARAPEHTNLAAISPSGRSQFAPTAPLYGPPPGRVVAVAAK